MAGATRMTGHRNHERSHNSIGSTQAKNSLPIRPTKGSGKGDLPPGKTFSKKKILHLEPTENYTFPGREIATSLFFSSFIFTFGTGIGRCHPSQNARLCREQSKLRTLSQNRHKKRHCRTFHTLYRAIFKNFKPSSHCLRPADLHKLLGKVRELGVLKVTSALRLLLLGRSLNPAQEMVDGVGPFLR